MLAPMISLASMGWPKFGCLDMYGDARATPYLSAQTRSFLWQRMTNTVYAFAHIRQTSHEFVFHH